MRGHVRQRNAAQQRAPDTYSYDSLGFRENREGCWDLRFFEKSFIRGKKGESYRREESLILFEKRVDVTIEQF